MSMHATRVTTVLLAAGCALLAGCSGSDTAQTPTAATSTPGQDARDAELQAKQQELERREAELKLKEEELDLTRREAELAAEKAAASKPAPKPAPARPVAAAKPKASGESRTAAATPPARSEPPAVRHMTIPSGTQLTVALASDLSTRTAKPGDQFQSRLVSDLVVDGRRAVSAGALVTGTVTDVVSGSNKIGGLPTLGLSFDHLQLDDGRKIAINGELTEQGKSDNVRDTAKILGGAAAGAILGHQVRKDNRGKVIGGLLGGAVGAVAAKKTGTEVELADGSQLTISLGAPIEITMR